MTQDISALTWWDMSPYEVREKINQRIMDIEAPTPSVGSVEDRVIKNETRNTPIRIYTPADRGHFPIILFIHGGRWGRRQSRYTRQFSPLSML